MPSPIHILAIETSTSLCDLALLTRINNETVVRCLAFEGAAQHAERLLPLVEQLLEEAGIQRNNLSAVAFGQGPGGFTGLRVACGIAQGIAFSLGIGVVPVSSLFAVAHTEIGDEAIRVVIQDARMKEVYLAAYQHVPAMAAQADSAGTVRWHEIQPPVLLAADALPDWLAVQVSGWQSESPPVSIRVTGDALDIWPDIITDITASCVQVGGSAIWSRGRAVRPSASAVARIALCRYLDGQISSPSEVAPLYVRDKVAFTVAERAQGKGGNPAALLPVQVRPMTESDIDAVLGIETSVQAFPWTRGNFLDALKADYPAWVIIEGKYIAGFYVAHYIPDMAHLLLIAVAPSHQRRGLGHRLLQHFEAQAVSRGVASLSLEVRQSNQAAIHFYQNRGFKAVGTRKNYYRMHRNEREDASVMEKTVRSTRQSDG